MKNSMLNQLQFDPAYIILGLGAVCILLFLLIIILFVKMSKINKKYNCFIQGSDGESLENIIHNEISDIADLKKIQADIHNEISNMGLKVNGCYSKIGIEKYDALKGMGGQVSFAMALLNYNNDGVIINSIHTREGSYLYLKNIEKGKCELVLGKEEDMALKKAL